MLTTDIVITGDDIAVCGARTFEDSQVSFVSKLDQDGNPLWERTYEDISLLRIFNSIDGGFIMTGVEVCDVSSGYTHGLIMKTDSLGYYGGVGIEPPETEVGLQLSVYPNPAASAFNVGFTLNETATTDLYIYDMSGRCVYGSRGNDFMAGNHQVSIDDLDPGIYLVRLCSGSTDESRKLVIIGR